jgi:uncharacterized membrane protein
MMYWNGDWNWGAWLAMAVMMLSFWGLVAWAVVTLVRGASGGRRHHDAESILAERLARGEISTEEFEDLRAAIRS